MNHPINLNNQLFKEMQSRLELCSVPIQRQMLVNAFIDALNVPGNYPIFEDEKTVVLIYQSQAKQAWVLGDMAENDSVAIPMQKIEATDLFYYRGQFEADARLEYWLTSNINELAGTDRFNPFIVHNGFGPMSELAMPKYNHHPWFKPYALGKKEDAAGLDKWAVDSKIYDYLHDVRVATPPEYKNESKSYPVVYFQDGLDYIDFAQSAIVIKNLIETKQIEPIIAVFVQPPNRHKPDIPNRMTEYGLSVDYLHFFCDELVPFIDGKYRTKQNAASRLVVGDSFGGLVSTFIPFSRPDLFKNGYSQSGYFSFKGDQLIKAFHNEETKDINLFIDIGTYEKKVGHNFLPKDEIDFVAANRRFKEVLIQKGYNFIYREYPEGHTWGNWRRHLIDGLLYFFKKEN